MPSSRSSRKDEAGCWDGGLVSVVGGCAEVTITGVVLCADLTCGNMIDTCDPLSRADEDDVMTVGSSIYADRPKRKENKSSSSARSRHSDKNSSLPSLNSRGYLDLEGRDDCQELLEIEATFNVAAKTTNTDKKSTAAKMLGRNTKHPRTQACAQDDDSRESAQRSKPGAKSPTKRTKKEIGSWMEHLQPKPFTVEMPTDEPKQLPVTLLTAEEDIRSVLSNEC